MVMNGNAIREMTEDAAALAVSALAPLTRPSRNHLRYGASLSNMCTILTLNGFTLSLRWLPHVRSPVSRAWRHSVSDVLLLRRS